MNRECRKHMNEYYNRTEYVAVYSFVDSDGEPYKFEGGCHLGLTRGHDIQQNKSVMYNRYWCKSKDKQGLAMFQFLTGEDSPWYPYFGDKVKPIYNTDGSPFCVEISGLDKVDKAVLFNYCVSHRHSLERSDRVNLWYKLVTKHGIDPRLAYVAMATHNLKDGHLIPTIPTQHFPFHSLHFSPFKLYHRKLTPLGYCCNSQKVHDKACNSIWSRYSKDLNKWYDALSDKNFPDQEIADKEKTKYPFLELQNQSVNSTRREKFEAPRLDTGFSSGITLDQFAKRLEAARRELFE